MYSGAACLPTQQPRSANPQPPASSVSQPAAGRALGSGAAAAPITIRPFKISKEATADQRRAERRAESSASTSRQEEFERKWCSHNPFKPIWRAPEPVPPRKHAKRKHCDEREGGTDESAGLPRHLELDKWLRHVLALRRRQEEKKEAAKLERRQRKEELDLNGKGVMSEDEGEVGEPRQSTLHERLLQAQIACREGSNRPGWNTNSEGSASLRRMDGWGGVDGVRCRLHSVDRLQGLEPSMCINLLPGGYSVEGDPTGRVYDKDSKELLAGLDRGKIPARKLLELSGHSNFVYQDGCLLVEVRDYRMPRSFDQKPAVWTMVLQPDSGAVAQDLLMMAETNLSLNSDDLLLVEKRMLLATQPAVCLSPHPHVAAVATMLLRRSNRMSVWHARPTRSAISQFRRTFDAGAMRRLHAAVHVSNTAGLEPAAPILAASTRSSATESTGSGEGVSRWTSKGVWKGNKLLEGWDIDGDGKDGAVLMATALRVLKGAKADVEAFAGPKSSHGMIGAKKDPRITEKAAADGSSGGERGVSRNHFLPRQYLRDGMPPERQMRFRKENQIVTIAIENKGASTYQLRSWLHELGADGKPLDNAQVQMPAQIVGNSVQARLFGGQLFAVYHREGWQCTGDSHQPATRKAAQGASGGAAHAAASSGDARTSAAARAGAQPASGSHGRGAASPAAGAGRGVSPGGRGMTPGVAYTGNGPGGSRAAAPAKPKQPTHVTAHPPVASPHMMAGRGAPQVHGAMPPGAAAAGQQRAPMAHAGAIPGQQMHMQQQYRPPVGMHQPPPQQQQHHPHQVPPGHAAHAHAPQGVPPYHAAAGRGYMPAHHHQVVAGRGVPAGQQPVVRPPVANVAATVAPPAHQVYAPHAGAAGVHHSMAAQQQVAATQPMPAGMPMAAAGAQMQHAAMAGAQQLALRPSPTANPPAVAAAAGKGQIQAAQPVAGIPPHQHAPHAAAYQQPPPNP